MKRLLLAIALMISAASFAQAPQAPRASEASIRELLEVTNAKKLLEGGWGQLDGIMENAMKDALGGKPVNAKQEALMAEMRSKTVELVRSEMNWERLEPFFIKMYGDTFSQSEMDGMLAFYKSDAGKAVIGKMPVLMQSLMANLMDMMQGLIPKVRDVTEEYTKKIKAAST